MSCRTIWGHPIPLYIETACKILGHTPSMDGSWCFGYDYICGRCGDAIGKWPDQQMKSAVDTLNNSEGTDGEKARRMANMSGGGS